MGFARLAFFLLAAAGAARADCDGVLSLAGKNVETYAGSEATTANKYAAACFSDLNTSTESTVAGLDIQVFGEGSLGGNLNNQEKKTRLTNWCRDNRSTYENNQRVFQQTQTIYGASVAAWRDCKIIENSVLQLNPKVHDDMLGVEFLVRTSDGSTSTFRGVVGRNFTCKAKLREAGVVKERSADNAFQITGEGVAVSCTRAQPQAVEVSGQKFSKYPAASITVSTAGNNFALEFAERQDPQLQFSQQKAMLAQIAALEAKVASNSNDATVGMKELKDAVARLDGETKYGGGFQVTDPNQDPSNMIKNALTDATSCPRDFRKIQTGRVRDAEPGVGANQYSCVKP